MSVFRVVAVAVTAGSVLGGTVATAQASEVARRHRTASAECSGAVTGALQDVTVKSGASCYIKNAHVGGAVTVPAGASLVIDNSDIKGDITSGAGAFVSVRNSQTGDISATTAATNGPAGGIFLDHANVGAARVVGGPGSQGLVADQATFRGSVKVDESRVALNDVAVAGDLKVGYSWSSGLNSVIRLAKVKGDVELSGENLQVCGGRFSHDVKISGNTPTFGANGATCGGNVVRGNLSYDAGFNFKYASAARVAGNTVFGTAAGTNAGGDSYPIKGSSNRFRGGVSGALADIKPLAPYDIPAPDLSAFQKRAQDVRDAAASR